jgi:hypothetical protein
LVSVLDIEPRLMQHKQYDGFGNILGRHGLITDSRARDALSSAE